MLLPIEFCGLLKKNNLSFYCGVPDSLLKHLCAYVEANIPQENHVITANEGSAVALACGHYLGTGHPAVVYMQNSGLGNAVNPIVSLADPRVYSIPMLLVIGWRGEPGTKDEPQHVVQGEISQQQLQVMGIPYLIVDSETCSFSEIESLLDVMKKDSRPVAILVRKDTFSEYSVNNSCSRIASIGREQVIEHLLDNFCGQSLVVSTTGKTSREVYEIRRDKGINCADFLTVGGMGHASSIAYGIAMATPQRRVICLDGDGAMLMHLGSLPVLASRDVSNFIHIILNNGCHESVGGQPTVADKIDLVNLGLSCGYRTVLRASTIGELDNCLNDLDLNCSGPVMIEIIIAAGSRKDLGRPKSTPLENKLEFMRKAGSIG